MSAFDGKFICFIAHGRKQQLMLDFVDCYDDCLFIDSDCNSGPDICASVSDIEFPKIHSYELCVHRYPPLLGHWESGVDYLCMHQIEGIHNILRKGGRFSTQNPYYLIQPRRTYKNMAKQREEDERVKRETEFLDQKFTNVMEKTGLFQRVEDQFYSTEIGKAMGKAPSRYLCFEAL